ncbi:MAG: ABC transporter ATP-binding protein [Lentisphaerales bacterium]|jgi:subfamily B ATP-binding cassette protein MsbA|nr:MAG: ABC transporter ATP-binding protein [Lentisphaerales bacterium]
MNGSSECSTFSAYKRLIPYLRPYTVRLAIGVVAGVVAGGSMFGLLNMSPDILRAFEGTTEGGASVVQNERATALAKRIGVPVMDDEGRMTWQLLILGLIALPILIVVRASADYINRYYLRRAGASVVKDMRDAMFDRLQAQSLKFYGKTDVGQLISRGTNDMGVIEMVISTTISDIVKAPIEIMCAAGFVVYFSMQRQMMGLMSAVLLVFPLCVVPIVILGRYVRRYTHRSLERISDLVSRMHENFTGIRIVKAFNMEKSESSRFAIMNKNYFKAMVKALRSELLMSPLMEGVALLLVCIFAVVCYARGVLLSEIMPIAFAGVVVYQPLKHLARINASIQRGSAAISRVFAVLDMDMILKEADNPVAVKGLNDRIVFDNVSFGYEDEGARVLQDIQVEIPRGTAVAVVGETGVGKSTMANLLARFYDPSEGRILLDGIDLRHIEIASLRRLIGVVTQETILFNDTIASNIAYGTPDASREQIEEAARMANAHEFITADPAGYDRVVGEKGFVLSGGERQRVSIARAILKNPPILILDEATSALDTVTERLVQEAIARVMTGRTVFAIAHRLSTVKHANQILLLEKGRIVERGRHDELLNIGGRYKALCEMQVLEG